jgi:hypothetical protein
VAEMLEEFCQAETDTTLLTPSNFTYQLDV